MYDKIQQTVTFLRQMTNGFEPQVGAVLGSGLGGLSKGIEIEYTIPYKDIPNFPVSTVAGHKGQLLFGTIAGKKIVAMQGRFHYYEGYTTKEVTFPIRVLAALGIRFIILSNASGGINPTFNVGDVMFISDHINLLPNPLIGPHDERLGVRFPDMGEAYNKKLMKLADAIAYQLDIDVQHGVYVGDTGPSYETPSEYQYYRVIGGDAVGMSTTPEAIVARQSNLPVFGVSVISDIGGKDIECFITHEEVISAVVKAEPKLIAIITELIRRSDEIQF